MCRYLTAECIDDAPAVEHQEEAPAKTGISTPCPGPLLVVPRPRRFLVPLLWPDHWRICNAELERPSHTNSV